MAHETQSDNPQTSKPLARISTGSSNIILTNYNDANHSQSYPAVIYDSLGHKIIQTTFFNNTASVDLSRFASGITSKKKTKIFWPFKKLFDS